MSTLSFHNFSWKGDAKWWNASRWTRYGPIVVCCNFAVSIVQLVCGSVWVVQLGSRLTVYVLLHLDRSDLPTPLIPTKIAKTDRTQTDDHTNLTPPRLFFLQRHPLPPSAHAAPQQPPQDGRLVLLHLRSAIPELRHPRPRRLRRLIPFRHPPRSAPRRMSSRHARRAPAGCQ